ncbi:substrate-binding periplasmic protein [Thalassotalea insulae]|uniref:substrate-binding periplasmic protein n=1 Tax=Thalassotalea insulae TaxID=2056778 RepID=UPI0024E0EAE0|nr:transporter substrate-binding domain-containing protein [Thalassotalea insulae]
MTEYLDPYQIKNGDGSLGGFSTDVIKALFKQANSNADFQVMSWARAYKTATTEKNVMIYSIAQTKERRSLFHWVGHLTRERLYFWGLQNQFPPPTPIIALLKGYRIATSKDSNVAQYLEANNFFHLYYITNEQQAMQMLYRNRIDLMIDTELNMQSRAKRLSLDTSKIRKITEVLELNNNLSIAFSKKSDPAMVQHFQQAYQAIEQQGIIKRLKIKWGIIPAPVAE